MQVTLTLRQNGVEICVTGTDPTETAHYFDNLIRRYENNPGYAPAKTLPKKESASERRR